MKYSDVIDKVVEHFTGPDFHDEVEKAKKEFFGPTGAEDEDSSQFDHKASQFLDWYIFDRELSDVGLSPLEAVKEIDALKVSSAERTLVENMLKRRHSLFEFLKIKGSDVYLKDLIDNKKVVVKDSPVTAGFEHEEVFETRLIPNDKNFVFTKGFCIHPAEAKKFILGEIKKVRKLGPPEKSELIYRLSRMRFKFDQYKHIRCDYIYTNDEKMRI